MTSPSTSLRVNGAKIIANLFTDVVVASNDIISEKLGSLCSLVEDPWWEVRAQALIIFKAILLSSYKNMSVSSEQRNMSGNGS